MASATSKLAGRKFQLDEVASRIRRLRIETCIKFLTHLKFHGKFESSGGEHDFPVSDLTLQPPPRVSTGLPIDSCAIQHHSLYWFGIFAGYIVMELVGDSDLIESSCGVRNYQNINIDLIIVGLAGAPR